MKISIITACLNNADTIEETILSVIGQEYAEREFIIVDGGSTDGTLEIIEKFKPEISKIVSEKDEGIYFALNKGIDLATGDVIAFLHADDVYANTHVIRDVMKLFSEKKPQGVYGDLFYVEREDISKVTRYWKSGKYKDGLFLKGWMPPHPAFFLKKSCYDKFGKFDTSFHSAADYELMLRMIHKNKISIAYLPEVLVKMRVGGKSNVTVKNRLKANREDKRAWKVNGLKPGLFTFIRKPLSKISQFFSK
jgi:glycosyltransferase